ncbi:MAG: hypothetical protein RIR97_1882 [Pseudomonadota bacterium]
MSLNAGLSLIHEDGIARHLAVAQSLVTKIVLLESDGPADGTSIAGTGRRFVSTVSSAPLRRTREVELSKAIAAVPPADPVLSPRQHAVLYRARRGVQIALAITDVFARQTQLESLQARNASAPLQGEDANMFKSLLSASAYIASFSFAAYLGSTLSGEGDATDDIAEPDYLFETPQDALKAAIGGLERAIAGAPDDLALVSRARAFARVALEGLIRPEKPVYRSLVV